MTWQHVLDVIADAINPSLLVLALAASWLQYGKPPWFFWGRILLSLGVVYGMMFIDKQFQLWPHWELDYSTHTAFAVAVIVSLGMWHRRWFLILIPVLVIYAALMMILDYHSLADIVTATLVIAPLTALIHGLGRRKPTSPAETRPTG
jgi:hypothetical protein